MTKLAEQPTRVRSNQQASIRTGNTIFCSIANQPLESSYNKNKDHFLMNAY